MSDIFTPFTPDSPPLQPAAPAQKPKRKQKSAVKAQNVSEPTAQAAEKPKRKKRAAKPSKPSPKFELRTILAATAGMKEADIAVFEGLLEQFHGLGAPARKRVLDGLTTVFA